MIFETLIAISLWCWNPMRDSTDANRMQQCRERIYACTSVEKKTSAKDLEKCFLDWKCSR